jgi:hypothetical protein
MVKDATKPDGLTEAHALLLLTGKNVVVRDVYLSPGEGPVAAVVLAPGGRCGPSASLPWGSVSAVGRDFITQERRVSSVAELASGVVPWTIMTRTSDSLLLVACEADITGAFSMLALVLASCTPAALVDWNNNYGDDPDKAMVSH